MMCLSTREPEPCRCGKTDGAKWVRYAFSDDVPRCDRCLTEQEQLIARAWLYAQDMDSLSRALDVAAFFARLPPLDGAPSIDFWLRKHLHRKRPANRRRLVALHSALTEHGKRMGWLDD